MTDPFAPEPFETPPTPRHRPARRWLVASIVPAVIGAGAALGVSTLVDRGGEGGGTVTVISTTASPAVAVTDPNPELPPATGSGNRVTQVVDAVSPGVVVVQTGTETNGSLGTGFLVDRAGHILTNAHVVAASKGGDITVTFKDETTLKATLLGRDDTTDVAVLKIDAVPAGAAVVPEGSVRDLHVGDPLIAIGNPLGLEQTVTTGVVSALKRIITSPNEAKISNVIQTDAAINHGNSGGPLLSTAGQVVGINSQIASDTGENIGIGFAVPIDVVRPVADSIIRTGHAEHAWMGITGDTVTRKVAAANNLGDTRGVMVVDLHADGPARSAGFKAATSGTQNTPTAVPKGGDVIIAVDGQAIRDMGDVSLAVSSRKVGSTITVTVLRGGATAQVKVTLADRPADLK